MGTRQIVIDVPENVLLAERTDEATFAREVKCLCACGATGREEDFGIEAVPWLCYKCDEPKAGSSSGIFESED